MRVAILQVADTGPAESLIVMLRSMGINCLFPSSMLKHELRRIGCDTILDVDNLVRGMGYDEPLQLPEAGVPDMSRSDVLYFDVKGHRNCPKVEKRWPGLKGKTCWYRINGGKPEHVIRRDNFGRVTEDCGDEVNPSCPVLTPNRWYYRLCDCGTPSAFTGTHADHCPAGIDWKSPVSHDYSCWPPFHRWDDYQARRHVSGPPICLVHNFQGWGYGPLLEHIRELGVRVHGVGSPDGLVNHREVPTLLSRCLAMVHFKSSDAPGYALYEALAAGCPLIVSRKLIWKNRMEDLLIEGETCLCFDRPTHEGLTQEDVANCHREIEVGMKQLQKEEENERIGENGRRQLQKVMWDPIKDSASLLEWMERNFKP